MKKLLKKSTLLFALILIISSCEKNTKSKDKLVIEPKISVKSDAKKVCELVSDIKFAISEVSNAINEGAAAENVEALNAKAKAINVKIKEIQKRNDGNLEFIKLIQLCYETMNK
tara:strand:+ start:198 stop:539 length:342 start_codon:yes stop_codon:yes gene_type:complete